MFFLGDQGHYYGRFPKVTVALVVVNVLVFTAQILIGDPFTNGFSLVPEEITTFRDLKGSYSRQVWVHTKAQNDRNNARYVSKSVAIQHYPGLRPDFLDAVHVNVHARELSPSLLQYVVSADLRPQCRMRHGP